MKHFLFLLLRIFVCIIISALILDAAYSAIYANSQSRGKIDFVCNNKSQVYDVVFLGSSRANNHFVPEIFAEKGIKSYNFGMCGSHLFETSLLLKIMIENKFKIKSIVLETDLNLSYERRANGIASKFLPFIHNSKAIRQHFKKEDDFVSLYYIPFYRYLKFENRIGFRELFFSAIGKRSTHLDNNGFSALYGSQIGNMKNNLKNFIPLSSNKHYQDIKQICAKNNIRLIAVMTPMCENVVGMAYFDKVKKLYPEIYNYENAVIEDENFSSCGHLNNEGAKKFTKVIFRDFFNK